MSKVFVSNWNEEHEEGPVPYSTAAVYGALVRVTSGNYPIFKTLRLQEEIARSLEASSDDDYLLLSGSSLVAGLCMTMWMFKHGRCKVLLLDRRERGYVVRLITKSTLQLTTYRDSAIQRDEGSPADDSSDDDASESRSA